MQSEKSDRPDTGLEKVDYKKLSGAGAVKKTVVDEKAGGTRPEDSKGDDSEGLCEASGGTDIPGKQIYDIFSDLGEDDDVDEGETSGEDGKESVKSTEIERLRLELEAAKREEKELKEAREVELLRRKLAAKKDSVSKLKGEQAVAKNAKLKQTLEEAGKSAAKTKADKDISLGSLTIDDLRKDKSLKMKLKAKMSDDTLKGLNLFGEDSFEPDKVSVKKSKSKSKKKTVKLEDLLADSDESDSDSDRKKFRSKGKKKTVKIEDILADSDDSDSERDVKKSKSKRRRRSVKFEDLLADSDESDSDSSDEKSKKKKSGIMSHSSDHVLHRQKYPQAYLRFEHVSARTTFEKLDINLFVAGELEIISSASIKTIERKSRLELLKRLMYLSSSYEFSVIKKLYAAVLREIELGHMDWGDDFQYVENSILSANMIRQHFNLSRKGVFAGDRNVGDKFVK